MRNITNNQLSLGRTQDGMQMIGHKINSNWTYIYNLGWHLNDVKLNKLRMKMNRTMNGVPMMRNLGNK